MLMQALTSSIKKIHFVKLETGEDVIETISTFCRKNNITVGSIFGLGAVKCANLGYFDIKTKEYKTNSFDFYAEIVNVIGNITTDENGEPLIHLHMAIGDQEGHVFGGHVLKGTIISVTGEFIIYETNEAPSRKLEESFNLKLWNVSSPSY